MRTRILKVLLFTLDQLVNRSTYSRSYDIVMDFKQRLKFTQAQEEALSYIINSPDRQWFEEQNFPRAHQTIFSKPKQLHLEIANGNVDMKAKDSQGCTALDWAVSRGQLGEVCTLLSSGADPDSINIKGRTTVLNAVDSGNIEVLRAVLEAGAKSDPRMPADLVERRDSPLTSATLYGRDDMVELLLRHGADINAENPEGFTALHAAAASRSVKCASILLNVKGADVNCVSSKEVTPLMAAVIHNSHEVLSMFLDKRTGPLDVESLLSLVAVHADMKTMQILKLSEALNMGQVMDISTYQELFASRLGESWDYALKFAFDELISTRTRVGPQPVSNLTSYK